MIAGRKILLPSVASRLYTYKARLMEGKPILLTISSAQNPETANRKNYRCSWESWDAYNQPIPLRQVLHWQSRSSMFTSHAITWIPEGSRLLAEGVRSKAAELSVEGINQCRFFCGPSGPCPCQACLWHFDLTGQVTGDGCWAKRAWSVSDGTNALLVALENVCWR